MRTIPAIIIEFLEEKMTKSRFAKFVGWLGQTLTAVGAYLAPKYSHYLLAVGAALTGWAIHNASDTSAGHPNGSN